MINFSSGIFSMILLALCPILAGTNGILLRKSVKIRDFFFVIISFIPLIFIGSIFDFHVLQFKEIIFIESGDFFIKNLYFSLKTSKLGNIFATLIAVLYPITTIYSTAYLHLTKDKNRGNFHFFICLAVFVTTCFAFSGNLFTSFIFYDILSIVTYFLVAHNRTEEAKKNALTYLLYLIIPSVIFLLPAIILIHNIIGNCDYQIGGIFTNIPLSQISVNILFGMFLFGISKTTLMPLYRWLLSAMIAPHPISGLLHAVLIVKSGAFFMFKVVLYIFGMDFLKENLFEFYNINWLMYIAIVTLLFASFLAIKMKNLKKRLAYSTISQLSYLYIMIFYFTKDAINAAIIHFIAHSLGKLNLFFYTGVLYSRNKINEVKEMKFQDKMSIFMISTFLISILSLIGLPPTIGFIGKQKLILSVLNHYNDVIIFIIIAITSIATIYYMQPFFYYTAISKIRRKNHKSHEHLIINFIFHFTTIILGLLIIILFILFQFGYIAKYLMV